jgi:hypothetical protein
MENPLPVLIVKPGTVSREDIERAEKRGFIIIIECTEPDDCRFLEPPCTASIDVKTRAAYGLMRSIVGATKGAMWERESLISQWAKALMDELPPQPVQKVLGPRK